MRWRRLLSLSLLLACALLVGAQDTGQICAALFDDRNGNSARDPDELPLVSGVGASALDARNVTVAAGLLEDSPFAADGLLCLDGLGAGDYLLLVTSSQYQLTTAGAISAAVEPGQPPARIDFGLSALFAEPAGAASGGEFVLDERALESALVALFGSGVTLVVMCCLGLLIYLIVFRRRLRAARLAAATAPWQQN